VGSRRESNAFAAATATVAAAAATGWLRVLRDCMALYMPWV